MPKVKVETVPTLLSLRIRGAWYYLERIQPHPEVARTAWRLHKADGTTYDVALTEFGAVCPCGDFLWRKKAERNQDCKHLSALREAGLLPPLQRRSK